MRRGHQRRRRRGDVRHGALLLLAEGPLNGYGIIRELAERSGGTWRPSSGAVYPALSLLEDEARAGFDGHLVLARDLDHLVLDRTGELRLAV